MGFPRSFLRLRAIVTALSLIALFWWISQGSRDFYLEQSPPISDGIKGSQDLTSHTGFWRQFEPLLMRYGPNCPSPKRLTNARTVGYKVTDPELRPEVLEMSMDDVTQMKNAHSGFVSSIASNPPKLHYIPGTRGLVSTAGGAYLPVLVISLRMLRRTGSTLPMEVFLANRDEYEEYICDEVLPSLNAKCLVLSEILDSVPNTKEIKKYQFKPFAMIFSSFEEILFLDADAFPIAKPEQLFVTEPFRSKKMVTWPDFWASSTSPIYYEISSQEVPPMELRQSTESGEVMISKKTHLRTLLLCTYYNFWGPTHYYPLFSQGAAGEGDKETFTTAATAVGEPFYQVSEPICAIGHGTKGGLAGSAMVQFDPADDYTLTQKGEWRIRGSSAPSPRAFFVHANFPKFNPATVFTKQSVNPAFNDDGSYTRAWTIPDEVINAFGSDVEKHFWEEIMWTGCELEDKFQSWKGQLGICDDVKKYWNAMFAAE
ncbi:hypothetical protein ASPZODRAFT_135783 [Penicilliopsis zonata CBS 506.65]|uniref:Alpha-1,2-mannosyltransferase n=1 Tax=Penicilliopsis zonata CBS 506.65 TaxID=1073090 RepID=A0A1L9S9B4_9EURO|nr:hypothetical protein ASPZODRAFT_135783 [Penicilliopsis zonata CBS 506.65]OJJ43762.1 hypothetical protein ASPZODRAFT_135783 [Penicilliopsis zonata CBS 506.65]